MPRKSAGPTTITLATRLSATLIGFSVAIVTLLITKEDILKTYPNIEYLFVFYVLTITFFIFSIEFLTLTSWDVDNYQKWAAIGFSLYSYAYGWLIIGLSVTFEILLESTYLGFFTLTLFSIFWLIYYILRGVYTEEPFHKRSRLVIRIIMLIQIFFGYIVLFILD